MKKNYSYPELTNLISALIKETEKYSSLTSIQLLTKPDPTSWCIGEIFEHINMFNEIYIKMIQSALKQDSLPTAKNNSFTPRFTFRPLINFIKPPYKVKIKTIAPMSPADSDSDEYQHQLAQILTSNRDLLTLIREFEHKKLDLNKIKVRNKIFFIKMSLIEYILMFEAHQSRHLWQTDQTLHKIKHVTDEPELNH